MRIRRLASILPLAVLFLQGCVSYPVAEFRGTTFNLDGNGRVATGTRDLGEQSAGVTPDGRQYFGLGLGSHVSLQLVFPRGQSLAEAPPTQISAMLVRQTSASLLAPAAEPRLPETVPMAGALSVQFRDNTRFRIHVALKGDGSPGPVLKGDFVGFHQVRFEPGAYLAGTAMAFGMSESAFGPATSRTMEGDMDTLCEAVAKLARDRKRRSFDVTLLEASRCLAFSNTTEFKDRRGIRLLIPLQSSETSLHLRMRQVCGELGLEFTEAASIGLAHPTVETEPHRLSVDMYGSPRAAADRTRRILEGALGATDKTRFRIDE